jgi:nitrate reductase NapAB chaperone NapD
MADRESIIILQTKHSHVILQTFQSILRKTRIVSLSFVYELQLAAEADLLSRNQSSSTSY